MCNSCIQIIIINSGRAKVRVLDATIEAKGRSGELFRLPAQTYFVNQDDKNSVLFTPFSLKADEEFSHVVCFNASWSRADDKIVRNSLVEVQREIQDKRHASTEERKLVSASPENIAPLQGLFNRHFKWAPDEYDFTLRVRTQPAGAVADHRYRIVLHESDTATLHEVIKDWEYGFGVHLAARGIDSILIDIDSVPS